MNDREQFEAWWTGRIKSDDLGAKVFGFEVWQAARATPAQPMGSPHNICREIERGLREYIAKLEANAQPSPSSVGDAIRAMPLPEPRDMDYVRWGYDADDMRTLLAEAAALAEQVQGQQVIPESLRKIGELLRTQDNRYTDQPMFIVQQKCTYVTEDGYNDCRYEWRETLSGEFVKASPLRAKRLDAIRAKTWEDPGGWKRFAVHDVWEFVTACFTEQGCKDYIASNGHNLKEPRIYADGSYRNEEYRAVRNWLMSLAAPSIAQDGQKSEVQR